MNSLFPREKSKLYNQSMAMAMALLIPKIVCNHNPNSFKPLRNNKAIGSSKVCKVKDCGDLDLRLYGKFSIPVMEESKEETEKQNYYVNLGYPIRALRDDFPQLFYKELSFHIYRDDIVFKDPLNTFIGIENYKSIFWALRFHGRIFFKALWVDLTSVWQPVKDVIMVRWTVHEFHEFHGKVAVGSMELLSINLTRRARFLSTGLTTLL